MNEKEWNIIKREWNIFLKKYVYERPIRMSWLFIWILIMQSIPSLSIGVETRLIATLISVIGMQVSLIWWFRE